MPPALLLAALPLAALSLAACGGESSGGPDVRVPHAEPPPQSGLVWVVDDEARHWTHWVSVEDGSSLSSQPIEGPLWADGDALWQWTAEPVEVPTFAEEPSTDRPDPADATGAATVTRGVMRELVTDASTVVVEAPSPGTVRRIEHGVRLDGSVGPFLFVSEEIYVEAWGAHGSSEPRALVWDLRAAAPAEILTERERATLAADAAAIARTRLVREGAHEGIDPELSLDEVELVALHPEWDPDHGLRVDLHFATAACYACGDGLFGDYTRSVRVEAPALPERLREHASFPAWVRATLERLPGARLLGFSVVSRPDPASILESLRR